jgi:glycosyltransferase involved in cell wall biosynthesis
MKVSVAVPVRNEEASLPALLESLLAQEPPPDEIVLADGGSTDSTVAVARRYAHRGVRILEIGPAYPGRGRNHAIAAAGSDWIALIDAGCVAAPGWLRALRAPVEAAGSPVRAVFGSYEPALSTEWEVAQALAFLPPADPQRGRAPFVASMLLHRSCWADAKGMPEDLRAAEDLVFFDRLAAAGVPSAFAPQARVRWSLPSTPAAAYRRFRLYAAHHLAAGLSRSWHRRVMAMDLVAVAAALAALRWPWLWVLLLAGAALRIGRTIQWRRGNAPDGRPWRPARVARVAVLLVLADLAVWVGTFDHVRGR